MRLALACLIVWIGAEAASAQSAPAPESPPPALASVYACAQITENTARLACYDQAVGRLQQAQSAGDLVAVDRHGAEAIRREAFGFQLPTLPRIFGRMAGGEQADLTELNLVIDHIARAADGKAVFHMTNGQVWRQIDDANIRRARAQGAVTVRRAALGSFLMIIEAGGPAIRVHRDE
ncbi:MAG: hypothetical protein ABUL55_00830 [Pseudomonadota bacterium]